MDVINETRLRVWSQQPQSSLTEAILDADGTLVETDAECKQGMDIAYDGTWGYHPLLISLANTAEPLYLVNRSGNRPSHEQAATSTSTRRSASVAGLASADPPAGRHRIHSDHASRSLGRRRRHPIHLRDRRHGQLKELADELPAEAYSFLERPPRYEIKTAPRQQPERVKEQIVREREFKTIHVLEEMSPSSTIAPSPARRLSRGRACASCWGWTKGRCGCSRSIATSSTSPTIARPPADEIVFSANDRCDQENLFAQLKSGVHALRRRWTTW